MTKFDREELATLKQGYDPVASRSWSLNSSAYIDSKYVDIEQTAIFRRSWQFACHIEKLREPGQYVTTEIGGHSIIVLRDSTNQHRAFYNVCKHRGHELLKGEGRKKLIVCPYHAWSYSLEGKLKAARGTDDIDNFNQQEICLSAVQVEEFCSLVFVNLDPKAEALASQSGDLRQEIESYAPDLDSLTFAHRLTYKIQANWKTVIDNFLECYHCPTAHRDFVSLVDMDSYQVTTRAIYSSHMAKAGLGDNSAYPVDSASVTDHAVWFLWPNVTLMRYPGRGNFMVWKIIPAGPEETYEEFDIFLETSTPNDAELEAIKYIDEVLQVEDIALVESVQRGMRTPAFDQGRYVINNKDSGMSEHAVHHFHGLVLNALEHYCDRLVS